MKINTIGNQVLDVLSKFDGVEHAVHYKSKQQTAFYVFVHGQKRDVRQAALAVHRHLMKSRFKRTWNRRFCEKFVLDKTEVLVGVSITEPEPHVEVSIRQTM